MGNSEDRLESTNSLLSEQKTENPLFLGRTFGPLMFLWFSSLFSVGLWRIRLKPRILHAINPLQAIQFLLRERKSAFFHIGSSIFALFISQTDLSGGVFLSVTGCEALYADLGKNSIRQR